jgi:hypothetical protein
MGNRQRIKGQTMQWGIDKGQTIQWAIEEGHNTMGNRKRTQYNGQ